MCKQEKNNCVKKIFFFSRERLRLTIDRGSHVLTFSHFLYLDNEARNAKLNRNSTKFRDDIKRRKNKH